MFFNGFICLTQLHGDTELCLRLRLRAIVFVYTPPHTDNSQNSAIAGVIKEDDVQRRHYRMAERRSLVA